MSTDSFDLKMNIEEEAGELFNSGALIRMSEQDFKALTCTLDSAFAPNAALQNALKNANEIKRS